MSTTGVEAGLQLRLGRYQGRLRRRARAEGYLLSDSAYEAGIRFGRHSHEGAFAFLVLEGECAETFLGRERLHRSGALVFHPPGREHSTEWLSRGRCFHITLTPERWHDWNSHEIRAEDAAFSPYSFASSLALRAYDEFRSPDVVSELAVEGLMTELLVQIARHRMVGASERTEALLAELEQRIADDITRDWRIADLARALAVEPPVAARLFRESTGHGLSEFLRQARIRRACAELERNELPPGQIAQALGFYDQSHFARTFKRVTGMTVTQYRKAR